LKNLKIFAIYLDLGVDASDLAVGLHEKESLVDVNLDGFEVYS
jgi:hypothetical protein